MTENECLEIAEKSREIYQHSKADKKLRRMLHSHNPPNASAPILPTGSKVAYYQEATGREPNYRGPGKVLGYTDGKYVLIDQNRYFLIDKAHVRAWPDTPESTTTENVTSLTIPDRQPPESRDRAHDEELQIAGSHPLDRVDPPVSYTHLTLPTICSV